MTFACGALVVRLLVGGSWDGARATEITMEHGLVSVLRTEAASAFHVDDLHVPRAVTFGPSSVSSSKGESAVQLTWVLSESLFSFGFAGTRQPNPGGLGSREGSIPFTASCDMPYTLAGTYIAMDHADRGPSGSLSGTMTAGHGYHMVFHTSVPAHIDATLPASAAGSISLSFPPEPGELSYLSLGGFALTLHQA